MKEQFLLNEVAKQLSLPSHVLSYAISSGKLPEPVVRINNKRIFDKHDVERAKRYFAGRKAKKEAHAK